MPHHSDGSGHGHHAPDDAGGGPAHDARQGGAHHAHDHDRAQDRSDHAHDHGHDHGHGDHHDHPHEHAHDHAHDHDHASPIAADDPRLLRAQARLDEARAAVRPSGLTAPRATGFVQPGERPGAVSLVVSRRLPVPQSVAWYNLVTSDGLARWFGNFDGDPATGRVRVTLLAEEGRPEVDVEILQCRAPERLLVRQGGLDGWLLAVDVQADVESSFVTLTHLDLDPAEVGDVGPGWEYYLDRWLAAEGGGDVSAVDFAEYLPAMTEHFTRQL